LHNDAKGGGLSAFTKERCEIAIQRGLSQDMTLALATLSMKK
jgi:hypothetical protein